MKWKSVLFALAILAIGVAGYGVMHGVIYSIPNSGGTDSHYLVITLVIIALGILVPFWMMKAGFKGAKEYDSHEKNIHLEDLPKDKEQAAKS